MAGILNPINQLMKNLAINKSLKQQVAQKRNGGTYMPPAPAQRIPTSSNPLTNTAPTLPVPDQSAILTKERLLRDIMRDTTILRL